MCRKGLGDRQIDLVLSDMAPSNPGFASVNHDMTLRLVYSVLEVIPTYIINSLFSKVHLFVQFSVRTAAPQSDLLVKIFAGSGLNKMIEDLGRWPARIKIFRKDFQPCHFAGSTPQ